MKIGTFTQDQDGVVTGSIRVLGLGVVPVALLPEKSKKDGKSYFRMIADPNGDPYEIGAAFERNKDGLAYHSVTMDSPLFPAAFNGALFSDKEHDGVFNLVWNRPQEEDKPASKLGQKAEANGEAAPEAGHAKGRKNGGPKVGATL